MGIGVTNSGSSGEKADAVAKEAQELEAKSPEDSGLADLGAELVMKIIQEFEMKAVDAKTYSPLTLAYVGDSIYDLVVRTILVEKGNAPVNSLHRRASSMVKAEAQRESLRQIEALLTEEEASVYRRGRNAKSYTTAKNASVSDYRIATGLEAVMGYLYLNGQTERMLFLIKKGLQVEKE